MAKTGRKQGVASAHNSCAELETVTRAVKWLVGLVGALAAVSCSESPFEPRGEGERVPVGTIIEQGVTGDSARWYSFAARPNGTYAVFFEALEGSASLTVVDSARQSLVASVSARQGGAGLDDNATNNFFAPTGGVYRLRVITFPSAAAARFRLLVYEINTAPENVPARFAIGDTVAGETIDPIVDGDQFFARGTAGQEVVLVMETLGPPGSGSVSLTVVDTVASTLLGYVFGDAGTPTLTTGRLRLPASQDYLFSVWSVTSNVYPRYRGPYRFWSYLINRAPEHRPAAIPLGAEVRGETIDRAGDVDEFTFAAAAGAEYNAFIQASRAVQLEVAPVTGPVLATVTSSGSDTALFTHATGRFQVPAAGTYIVRVSGTAPSQIADTGAYRLFLYPIDRRPEHVSAAITPGDTVSGEQIDLPGDVDEFTFSGVAGEEFNVFFQAESGSPQTMLQLEVVDGAGTVLRTVQSVGTDTSLLRQVTGRFALPGTGTYRLRVSGAPSYPADFNRGPYRLFLYPINRRPETVPATLTFGDSVSGEAIDLPGDVDEFRVTVPDSSGANLVLEVDSPSDGGLMAQLVDSATGHVIATTTSFQVGTPVATGRLPVAPGKYIVRVGTSGDAYDRSTFRGAYRLWFYRFSYGPEAVPDTFAIGDTVSGEAIDPPGDIDVFHFHGVRGQHVNIALQGMAAPSAGGFQAFITGPTGYSIVFSGTSAAALGDHQTLRVDLPATGWYEIDVSGAGFAGAGVRTERGPYRFIVEPLGTAPEHVGSALVPGDSVTTEAIDGPGDWDEYTVTASPGQDVGVIVHSTRTDFLYPYLRIFDRATGDSLLTALYGDHLVGPFRVPASGQVGIAVYQPDGFFRFCYDATCGGYYRFVGAYAFRVITINRAPENVSAAYTVGDTVRGEAIFPAGDIDEFTTTAVPGDTLTAYIRLTAPPVGEQDQGLTLEVIDPATGNTLIGMGAQFFGQTFNSVGSFTVPAGGGFLIRVRGSGTFGDQLTTAPYEFFLRRGP